MAGPPTRVLTIFGACLAKPSHAVQQIPVGLFPGLEPGHLLGEEDPPTHAPGR